MLSRLSHLFNRSEQFTTTDDNSPAARAQRVWDEREGGLIVQNANLRKMIMGLMACTIGLTGGIIYVSSQASIIPYVVEVDGTTGQIRNVGTVESSKSYQANEHVIKYFIVQFLKNIREIPLDQVVYREHISTAYGFLTKDGAGKLNTFIRDDQTIQKFGQKTVQIEILSLLPVTDSVTSDGASSWQIRWNEDEIDRASGERTITPYTGIISIRHIDSSKTEDLMVNPLGIYIYDFNISKDATVVNTKDKNVTNIKNK